MSRRARTATRKQEQAARRAALTTKIQVNGVGSGEAPPIVAGAELCAPAHLDLPPRDLYPGPGALPDYDRIGGWLHHRLPRLQPHEMHHPGPELARA